MFFRYKSQIFNFTQVYQILLKIMKSSNAIQKRVFINLLQDKNIVHTIFKTKKKFFRIMILVKNMDSCLCIYLHIQSYPDFIQFHDFLQQKQRKVYTI